MKKPVIKLLILLFTIGILIFGTMSWIRNHMESEIPTRVLINIDEDLKDDIEVYINPHGYELANYRPFKYIGNTNIVYPLLIKNKIQNTNFEKISEFSDYNIYAKYKDSYALIRTTNTIVLGNSKTNIELSIIQDNEKRPYISVLKSTPTYQSKPNDKIGTYSYFYDKLEYKEIYDKSEEMLNSIQNIEQ